MKAAKAQKPISAGQSNPTPDTHSQNASPKPVRSWSKVAAASNSNNPSPSGTIRTPSSNSLDPNTAKESEQNGRTPSNEKLTSLNAALVVSISSHDL